MNAAVSVVIPNYNREGLLPRAIESVLVQSRPPQEVLVVDDGSTDGSAAAARRYGPPVRVLHQENRGPGAARNRGLDEAVGEWVAFLDSDDYWAPAKLERQLAAVRDGAVAVHTHARKFGAQNCIVELPAAAGENRYSVELLLTSRQTVNTSSLMVRRAASPRFPLWTRNGEDTIFVVETLRAGPLACVPEVLVHTYKHAASLTHGYSLACRNHAAFDRWLDEDGRWVDRAVASRVRQFWVDEAVRCGRLAYWARDWTEFGRVRAYLVALPPSAWTPAVRPLLEQRIGPKWLYRIKDRWDGLWEARGARCAAQGAVR